MSELVICAKIIINFIKKLQNYRIINILAKNEIKYHFKLLLIIIILTHNHSIFTYSTFRYVINNISVY
jgi:hypothetical protein